MKTVQSQRSCRLPKFLDLLLMASVIYSAYSNLFSCLSFFFLLHYELFIGAHNNPSEKYNWTSCTAGTSIRATFSMIVTVQGRPSGHGHSRSRSDWSRSRSRAWPWRFGRSLAKAGYSYIYGGWCPFLERVGTKGTKGPEDVSINSCRSSREFSSVAVEKFIGECFALFLVWKRGKRSHLSRELRWTVWITKQSKAIQDHRFENHGPWELKPLQPLVI